MAHAGNQKYLRVHHLAWVSKVAGPKSESRKAANFAYIEHQGPYDQVPWDVYIKRLYGWAKEQKVMPGFYPIAIFYDDPEKNPLKDCRSDIAIAFKGRAKEQAGAKTRLMAAMKVATISHQGPWKGVQKHVCETS